MVATRPDPLNSASVTLQTAEMPPKGARGQSMADREKATARLDTMVEGFVKELKSCDNSDEPNQALLQKHFPDAKDVQSLWKTWKAHEAVRQKA